MAGFVPDQAERRLLLLRRVLAVILPLTTASLLVVACGDDDEGSAAQRADTPEVTDGADDERGSGAADDSDRDAGEVDVIDISSLTDTECLKLGNALTTVVSRGVIGDFAADLATFRSFAAGAQAETHDDFETFLGAYEASYRLLDDAGVSLSDASSVEANRETMNAAKQLIETAEVEAALAAAEAAFFDACPVLRSE